MKTQILYLTDHLLRDTVIAQLDFELGVNSAGIGVSVEDSVVTLSGFVDSYVQKMTVERVVKRLFDVKGIANKLQERKLCARTDADIAKDAVYILECDVHFPGDKVTVIIEDGLLTLEGTVDWSYQKEAAERAVQLIKGVKSVANFIAVSPAASPANLQKMIEGAPPPALNLFRSRSN